MTIHPKSDPYGLKTCPRCYHSMDEHDFQRCNHLAGTAERCRCWVPNTSLPRWYGPLVVGLLLIIAGLALTGCGAPPCEENTRRCEGRDMYWCINGEWQEPVHYTCRMWTIDPTGERCSIYPEPCADAVRQ
jgi:hypothetical protein